MEIALFLTTFVLACLAAHYFVDSRTKKNQLEEANRRIENLKKAYKMVRASHTNLAETNDELRDRIERIGANNSCLEDHISYMDVERFELLEEIKRLTPVRDSKGKFIKKL